MKKFLVVEMLFDTTAAVYMINVKKKATNAALERLSFYELLPVCAEGYNRFICPGSIKKPATHVMAAGLFVFRLMYFDTASIYRLRMEPCGMPG